MPHPPRSARAWPIRHIIAGITVIAMTLVAVVLISLSWFGSKRAFLDMAQVIALNASQLTAERSRRMIAPGEAMLNVLASNPFIRKVRENEEWMLRTTLAPTLAANPLISSLYVGYRNGDFLSLRPLQDEKTRHYFQAPPRADYLINMLTRLEDGSTRNHLFFYDAQHELLTQRDQSENAFDPRTRPWYTQSMTNDEIVTSGPYAFFTNHQAGITLSRSARSGQAVVGVDITLTDLGKGLASLRMTPSAELALATPDGTIIAYSGATPPASIQPDGQPRLSSLDDLGAAALSRLWKTAPSSTDSVLLYEEDGREWLGAAFPFDGIQGLDLQLLVTAPADELLGDLARNRMHMVLISSVLILLLLPLGWSTGSSVGHALERLTDRARRMSLFDFSRPGSGSTRLREVGELNQVMNHVGGTVQAFLEISQTLGSEPRIEAMLAQVLEKLVKATRCLDGAVYLSEDGRESLLLAATFNVGKEAPECGAWPEHWPPPDVDMNDDGPHERITFELRSRRGHLEGLLVLTHARDPDHTSPEFLSFTNQLTGMLAMSIEARQFMQAQKELLDAIIRVLADAIDAKSPYTGGHCERVPQLAIMLADQIAAETSGPYADFTLNEDERYEFRLAAWLHDCGKVTSPEHIIDKATKLEVIHNRIHEIRMRFEVLWRDAEINRLQARLAGEDEDRAAATLNARHAQLQDDFRFVAQCNIGGEFLSDEAIARLHQIAETTWMRHFDDSIGLSSAELAKLAISRPHPPELPAAESLLADKPEHIVPWDEARKPAVERDDPRNTLGFDMKLPACRQNAGELHNLTIRRGTLTEEDRFAINDHMVQTLTMLTQLPWPRHLERVPDIAANHHERMDGAGYPRRIPGEKLQLTERIMALVDVFEALTAADRPYKPSKTLSESLRIMAFMCRDGHLDPQLYLYFLRSPVWLAYARDFMKTAQIDAVDAEALARIAEGK
ncbi:HD domain-containing phosphohydrolase [Castellaniella sp.]|uniref:HD domain-containing phosphohydrolase n=1 Tax=Castellaniella sp. TaxID=1955812 RepID=UPI003C760EC2